MQGDYMVVPDRVSFFLGSVFGVLLTTGVTVLAADFPGEPRKVFQNLIEIWNRIEADHVEPVAEGQLLEGCLDGMLSSLNDGSAYLSTDDFTAMNNSDLGSSAAVGLELQRRDNKIVVVSPLDNTPAMRAGIRSGDVILSIDGISIVGIKLLDAVKRLRGALGSDVVLSVNRNGFLEPLAVRMRREKIQVDSVRIRTVGDGVIVARIGSFTDTTSSQLKKSLDALLGGRPQDKLLILDLRNNSGGLLDGAVATANIFVRRGTIFTMKGRAAGTIREQRASGYANTQQPRIAVLVNNGSAAASEILTSALRAHAGALVVGQRTFGRGSVETVMPLQSGAAIRLTTGSWYDAMDEQLEGKGLMPDIELPTPPDNRFTGSEDPWIERAVQLLREQSVARPAQRAMGAS